MFTLVCLDIVALFQFALVINDNSLTFCQAVSGFKALGLSLNLKLIR